MPPKSVKSPKTKAEWLLCNETGIWYHSLLADQHSSWVSSGDRGSTTQKYAHIVGDIFNGHLSIHAHSVLASSLSPRLAFSSVFIHPSVAKQCGIGQAQLVKVKVESKEVVLSVFSSAECPISDICCTRNSWIDQVKTDETGMISLERFFDEVNMCTDVSVMIENSEEDSDINTEDDKVKLAIKHHLIGLVIADTSTVPFTIYGAKVLLKLMNGFGQTGLCDLSINLQHLRLNSSLLTSTPHKQVNEKEIFLDQKNYYRISTCSNLSFTQEKMNSSPHNAKFVGGLDKELDLIFSYAKTELFEQNGKRVTTGILLHGPSGTGKSLLAESLAPKLQVKVERINGHEIYSKFYGETEKNLREKFFVAKSRSPCILLIDELDSVAPRREAGGSEQERRVIASLLSLLDSLKNEDSKVLVLATTSKLDNVEPSLRRPGRFDLEIEIGVPSVAQRKEILNGMLNNHSHELNQSQIDMLSNETHGFVGADLDALVNYAQIKAKDTNSKLAFDHLVAARLKVKPSAMREVMVEVPQVTWNDIGGLEVLKLKLRQAVEWPIKHPEVFTRMGISAPKGLLMYGPPGCSKTMIAKALANESGLNFLSIKGPELFSKWVGESERAVREVFRKARQVKPSIVFFDEIDAVGGSRGGGGSKVGDRVLAQLLTEMDGVESLQGVTVVAATNRPDMMDKALLRPGRLDRIVYVPLPDLETRRKVLDVHTRNIPISDDVNLDMIAIKTDHYSGAEIAAVCNEAALTALEDDVNINRVTAKHFEIALSNLKPRIPTELFEIYRAFQSQA